MVDVAAHSLPEEVLFKMSKGFGNAHVPPPRGVEWNFSRSKGMKELLSGNHILP